MTAAGEVARGRGGRRSRRPAIGGDRRGIAAVEFALIAPFLITVVVGLVDLGVGLHHAMQVDAAAQAGLQYALVKGYDPAAISAQIAATSQSFPIEASPSPQRYCGCPGEAGIAAASCGVFCGDGSTAGTYVSVSASATYVPPIAFPLVPASYALQSNAVVRVQ